MPAEMSLALVHALPADVATGGEGGDGHLLVIVVVVLVVGLIMHRIVGPLLRTTLHLIEWLADTSIKIGFTLILVGGGVAALAVLYLLSPHSSGA